jgi:hypothetical protein
MLDSYHDEFMDILPRSYSHAPPRFYSRACPRTFSRALPHTSSSASPQFAYGPNHRSYGFGPRENHFEPRRFGYGPRPHRGLCSTRPSGAVQRTVETSSGRMVKCWIPKIYLTNPNTEPSTFSHPV